MFYNIEITKLNQQKTSEWSGGTTTELYIYPKDEIYSNRNFKWRLSSAKVEVEQSTFTPLLGISRLIMIIDGELLLEHEGHHNAILKPFEQDSFRGEWKTTSHGKVTDFNLMLTDGYKGKLEFIALNKGEVKKVLLHNYLNSEKFSRITEAFYIVKGDVELDASATEKTSLNKGDLALVTRTDNEVTTEIMIYNSYQKEAKIIRTTIFNKE